MIYDGFELTLSFHLSIGNSFSNCLPTSGLLGDTWESHQLALVLALNNHGNINLGHDYTTVANPQVGCFPTYLHIRTLT